MKNIEFFIVTAILFLIPAISQLRIYYKTRLKPYALLGSAFIIAIIDSLIYGIQGINIAFYKLPNQITYYLTYYLILMAMLDASLHKYKVQYTILTVLTFIGSVVSIQTILLPTKATGIFMEIFRIASGGIMLYGIIHSKFIAKKKGIILIRSATATIGFCLVVMGGLRGAYFISVIYGSPLTSEIIMNTISQIPFAIIGILATVLSLFVPYLFLITISQLMVAYQMHEEVQKKHNKIESEDMLSNYLNSLPLDLLQKLRGDHTVE